VLFKVGVYSIYESHSFIWFQSNSVERHGRIQVGDTITHIDGTPVSVGPRSIPIMNSKDKPEHFSTCIYIYIYIISQNLPNMTLDKVSDMIIGKCGNLHTKNPHAWKKCKMFDL
jgi:hypothetical protein